MKKIMLAMMATVGLAFFAKATTYTGSTDFEDGEFFVVGEKLPDTDKGSGTETVAFWDNYAAAVGESKIVAGGPRGSTKYASLDTDNKVLLRQAVSGTPVSFGQIYFDTMVQFTASEGDSGVSTSAVDKLVIWLQSNEASEGTPASTNLMIRAGLLDTDFNATKFKDYQVEGEFEAGVWYRLTVKTFADIGLAATVPGFKVYIDGEEVSVTEGSSTLYNGYFASLVSRAVGTQQLTGIGFQGTGAVDNIAMTSDDPIPPVETTFPMTLTVEDEDAATDMALYVQDAAVTNEFTSGVAVDVLKETTMITIVVGVFDGYEVTDFTKGGSYENNDGDPCTYYTKDVAVTPEMLAEGYALTLTVVADGGEEATDISTAVVVLSADSIKVGEACPTVTSVTVSEVPLALDTDYTVVYPDVSTEGEKTITLTGNGKYTGTATKTFTVTAAEPTTVVTPTAAAIESGEIPVTGETTAIKIGTIEVPIAAFDVNAGVATVKAPVVAESAEAAGDAFVIDDKSDEVTINVNPVAGLYYGVSAATDLDALARPATLTQYDGKNAADIFTVSKPGDEKGFFKVYSDVKE